MTAHSCFRTRVFLGKNFEREAAEFWREGYNTGTDINKIKYLCIIDDFYSKMDFHLVFSFSLLLPRL